MNDECMGYIYPAARADGECVPAQEFVAIAGAEAQRNAEPDPEKRKYPGGAFDPLGFSKDAKVGCWHPLAPATLLL